MGKEKNQNIAEKLASGYSPLTRFIEILSLLAFLTLTSFCAFKFKDFSVLTVFSTLILGILLADFVSGVVHWAADTWGTVEWPIVGPTLIRSFREHHVNPKSITLHDFIETNGASALVSLPVLSGLLFLPLSHIGFQLAFGALFWMVTWVLLTNQIHKWSHQDRQNRILSILQRGHLILSPQKHRKHHTYPFTQSYCITTGWLNGILDTIGFFRGLESLITRLTGAKARDDDMKTVHAHYEDITKKKQSSAPAPSPDQAVNL